MPKLTDLGITKTESRWQRLASLSKKQQEDRIEQAKRNAFAAIDGTAKLERIEMRAVDEARVRTLVVRPGRYRALVVDLPWGLRVAFVGRPRQAWLRNNVA